MIVIAIVGILAAVALPIRTTRLAFTEVVNSTAGVKGAVEECVAITHNAGDTVIAACGTAAGCR